MEMLTKNMKQLIQEVKNEMRRDRAKAFEIEVPPMPLTDLTSLATTNNQSPKLSALNGSPALPKQGTQELLQ